MNSIIKLYQSLFDFLTKEAIDQKRYASSQAHCLLGILFSTGVAMWSYAVVAHLHISHPLPGIIGYSMSTIHLLSMFLLLWPKNISLAIHTLIGSGFIHQTCFSYFTGGILSNIPIWYSLLPILGGIVLGKKGALTWFFITLFTLIIFLILELTGHSTPYLITDKGWLYAQLLLTFAWIGISTGLIILYNYLREKDLENLSLVNKRIKSLLMILSHDLATPLTILKSKIQNVKEPSLANSLSSPLSSMEETLSLVRQWEAIQAGKITLEEEKVDLSQLLTELSQEYHEKLLKKYIQLNLENLDKPQYALGDRAILKNQILSNLLSNAIKFTPSHKSITLKVIENQTGLEVHIADEGIGVDPDIKDHLFLLNFKTSRKGTNGESGTGFGLPIAKTYIDQMGGSLSFHSHQGQGTTFIAHLRAPA